MGMYSIVINVDLKNNSMNSRNFGYIQIYKKIRKNEIKDYLIMYRGLIYLGIITVFMIVFGAIALYQQDATRNLMMVNDIENQKVDKIEQERLFLYR